MAKNRPPRWVLSQRDVDVLRVLTQAALVGCLLWAAWTGQWWFVAGNIVALVVTRKRWRG